MSLFLPRGIILFHVSSGSVLSYLLPHSGIPQPLRTSPAFLSRCPSPFSPILTSNTRLFTSPPPSSILHLVREPLFTSYFGTDAYFQRGRLGSPLCAPRSNTQLIAHGSKTLASIHPIVPSVHSRYLSFNLFKRNNPPPSPMVLAQMVRLEADANAHPQDVEKQIVLWQEMVKYPVSQKRVISLYERLVEFDKHSPLIGSPQIFQLYLRALVASGQASSIDPAVRHRDALLAAPSPEPEPIVEALSPSQLIAREVLASSHSKPKEPWVSSIRGRLTGSAAATSSLSGVPDDASLAGGKASPIHVVVEERAYFPPLDVCIIPMTPFCDHSQRERTAESREICPLGIRLLLHRHYHRLDRSR
jgi:hypothetical protein